MNERDGLQLNTARFDAAVTRLASTSKRAAVDVMRQQARLLFVQVAKITPPYHEGATGRVAEAKGKTKVASDIYSLYGTRSDAYDAIEDKAGERQANAFWSHLGQGNIALANSILGTATGKNLSRFDGGALHRRTAGGSKRRTSRREHAYYVLDAENLASYVTQEQSHVWWLASGWSDALIALGASVPYGVKRHNAPGSLFVEVNDQRIVIAMRNEVSYGRQVRDIERRIQAALRYRTGTLDRAWTNYLDRASKNAGFTRR